MKMYTLRVKGKKGCKRLTGETPTEAFAKEYPNCELVVVPRERGERRYVEADVSIELVGGTRKSVNYYKVIKDVKKADSVVKKGRVIALIDNPFAHGDYAIVVSTHTTEKELRAYLKKHWNADAACYYDEPTFRKELEKVMPSDCRLIYCGMYGDDIKIVNWT